MSQLYDSYNTNDDGENAVYGDQYQAQTFKASDDYYISSVKLKLFKGGSPTFNLVVALRATTGSPAEPTGSDLTSGTIGTAMMGGTPGNWFEINFHTPYKLTSGTTYAIVVYPSGNTGSYPGAYVMVRADGSSPTYSDGMAWVTINGGSTWSSYPTIDLMFETYGGPIPPIDKTYSKSLVAIANNEVWYEFTSGTMVELAAANGDINIAKPLTACEAFQKAFIANNSILRVIDKRNSKLVTEALGTVPPRSTILTGGTSGAQMVVDFCDAVASSGTTVHLYGYRITADAFVSAETVTGGGANSISFALTTCENAPPHWYNWTPYGNDTTTYGSMPTYATLVCSYRGRVVVAGNPYYPHMWYMPRVLDPWDWLYVVNDPLTPIRGGNAEAGEVGDIIRALIPYRDDYLIFGCANSMWMLRGDAAYGGTIDLLTDKSGVFGARAWCFDDNNNLYFFGANGLYKVPVGAGISSPENISELALPEWVADWAIDLSEYRIVLTFDSVKRGIIVSRTKYSDGSNENYWFDFKTGGFFPETYPDECGIYSSVFYNATDDTYRTTLFGCNDGYVRKFLDTAKDDDVGATDDAIESYVVCPIIPLSDDPERKGKVLTFSVINAGGASGGAYSDTDTLNLGFFVGDGAEVVLEDIKDGATAFLTVSLISAGRKTRIRTKMSGAYFGVKVFNSAVDETWAVEKMFCTVKDAGRVK